MLSPLIGLLLATSLAPVDPELIRSTYGQEALFRVVTSLNQRVIHHAIANF